MVGGCRRRSCDDERNRKHYEWCERDIQKCNRSCKGIGGLGKGAAGSALQAAAGLGGLGKGLVGSKGNNGQQSSLHEEMKKAGVGGGNGKDASKGQQEEI
ncbi:hypothetical protein F6Y05_01635 (plasmid) [Bacillus megaterium]|nr:hypothetical protein [Priestia megaterium]